MKTGIQVSSLKPLLGTPEQVHIAFDKMAALGCRSVQLQWIDPSVAPEVIGAEVKRTGMESVGTQDFYDKVRADLNYYVNLNKETCGPWLTVSRIPERCKSREGLDVFVRELRQLQEYLAPLGQKLCLHPVTADYTALPGFDAVGYLMEQLPELTLCLDLFHLNRNCDDMPAFIRRYSGRIPMVHFKDADAQGKLVPAGSGIVRWQGVMEACLEAGVEYGFAEQETWDTDPYQCLSRALVWIESQM